LFPKIPLMQEESYKLRNNIEIIYIKSYYFQLNMVIPEWYNMAKKRSIKY